MSYRQKQILISGNMILPGVSLQIHEWPQRLFELHAPSSLSSNLKLYSADPNLL